MRARKTAERLEAVRSVVEAARRVFEGREALVDEIAHTTGLSPEGVRLGFEEHLEIQPTDAELDALLTATAGDAEREPARVHVILSAGVFVSALRAIAVASATAPVVTVHASRRDPVFARALVEALDRPSVTFADEPGGADEIHVYGRDETTGLVAARAGAGTRVKRHGAGLGIAWLAQGADEATGAAVVARDVVPFDQRGCLSPRVVLVHGTLRRAHGVADALAGALEELAVRIPRGERTSAEKEDGARYEATLAFAGRLRRGVESVVGCGEGPIVLPPSGRYVHVCAVADAEEAASRIAPFSSWVVAVGADEDAPWAPAHARRARLGRMQQPPLDGPVDLRPVA